MGWLYILIRTFPFWAVPLAATFSAVVMSHKGKKLSGKTRAFYLFLAGMLGVASIAFFYLGGPTEAVPFVHGLIYYKD